MHCFTILFHLIPSFLNTTIIHKTFETISSFYVKWLTTRKVKLLFLMRFWLVLTNLLFWEEDRALGNNLMRYGHFLDIWQVMKQLAHTNLLLVITFRFTVCKRKIYLKVKKSPKNYEHDCRFLLTLWAYVSI